MITRMKLLLAPKALASVWAAALLWTLGACAGPEPESNELHEGGEHGEHGEHAEAGEHGDSSEEILTNDTVAWDDARPEVRYYVVADT